MASGLSRKSKSAHFAICFGSIYGAILYKTSVERILEFSVLWRIVFYCSLNSRVSLWGSTRGGRMRLALAQIEFP